MKFAMVRAWMARTYHRSLDEEHQVLLPANSVGQIELSDADLQAVHGGLMNTNMVVCQPAMAPGTSTIKPPALP